MVEGLCISTTHNPGRFPVKSGWPGSSLGQGALWDRELSGTGSSLGQGALWDRELSGTGSSLGQGALWDRELSRTGSSLGQGALQVPKRVFSEASWKATWDRSQATYVPDT